MATNQSEDEPELFTLAGAKPKQSPEVWSASGRAATTVSHDLPKELLPLVEAVLTTAAEWLARNEPADFRADLLTAYFELFNFARTAEVYDERYVTLHRAGPFPSVKLFCRDPSHRLREALERARAAIFFSATLTPLDFFRQVLGGLEKDPGLQLASPFPRENLAVLVHNQIRTQAKDRMRSLDEVVLAIGAFVGGRAGNYLVYLPAYQYLRDVLAAFQTAYPSCPVLAQRPGMTDEERDAFLAAFGVEHERTQVGFAVLGGIFGEGIDLLGDRLIGAVVVGVGLPQLEPERDSMADYFQTQNGQGFDYAYTFPGMNRVLQATGRVIRTGTDRGIVLLIDSRFGEPRYRRLFPDWWQPIKVGSAAAIRRQVAEFWAGFPSTRDTLV